MLTYGFDSIASMDGESVTGGRLNLYKSLQAFEQYDTTSTGIAAKVIENKLMLTPNPVDDRLTISTNNQLASVECYSVLGELVFKKQVMDNEQVDVSSIESGVYFFQN